MKAASFSCHVRHCSLPETTPPNFMSCYTSVPLPPAGASNHNETGNSGDPYTAVIRKGQTSIESDDNGVGLFKPTCGAYACAPACATVGCVGGNCDCRVPCSQDPPLTVSIDGVVQRYTFQCVGGIIDGQRRVSDVGLAFQNAEGLTGVNVTTPLHVTPKPIYTLQSLRLQDVDNAEAEITWTKPFLPPEACCVVRATGAPCAPDDLTKISGAHAEWDNDNDGTVSFQEFSQGITQMGFETSAVAFPHPCEGHTHGTPLPARQPCSYLQPTMRWWIAHQATISETGTTIRSWWEQMSISSEFVLY